MGKIMLGVEDYIFTPTNSNVLELQKKKKLRRHLIKLPNVLFSWGVQKNCTIRH